MNVSTSKVKGRRKLRFSSMDEVLSDARQMATREYAQLGNWTLGMAMEHLAKAINSSIDGVNFKASWIMRKIGPLMKRRFLTKPMPSGFKLPTSAAKDYMPQESVDVGEALQALTKAIARLENESNREPHAIFGKLNREEWDQLHLRHAELHLSFFVPADSDGR